MIVVVVVILMVVVNRMYKKRNGISLGRSPWRIDNCSIHPIQTLESTAPIILITLAISVLVITIINGINLTIVNSRSKEAYSTWHTEFSI